MTYQQILEDDPMYCAVILTRTDAENPEQELAPSPAMRAFSDWLDTQDVRGRCATLLGIQAELEETYAADEWNMEAVEIL